MKKNPVLLLCLLFLVGMVVAGILCLSFGAGFVGGALIAVSAIFGGIAIFVAIAGKKP